MEGKITRRCRRERVYTARSGRNGKGNEAEPRTKQTVVGPLKRGKIHIMLQVLFAWYWLQRAQLVAFSTSSVASYIDYLSYRAS